MSALRRASLAGVIAAALASASCGGVGEIVSASGATAVSIFDNFYQPDSVTIAKGGSVRWTNHGALDHRVVSDSSGLFASPTIAPNTWFQQRFDSAGTFRYHCGVDTSHVETGVVIVQ